MTTTIGIITFNGPDYWLRRSYIDSVRRAGAVAIMLPPGEQNTTALLQHIDGLILAGGGDLEPSLYGGSSHPNIYGVDHERDAFELELARRALEGDIPVLGICRGMQLLSVACGVALVTHVPDHYGFEIMHRGETDSGQCLPVQHEVLVKPSSKLAHMVGTTKPLVVSWHHQALKEPPEGWQVVGVSTDGVIEAIEHHSHPWAIGTQWHPELSPESLEHQQIFQSFVQAASERCLTKTGERSHPLSRN